MKRLMILGCALMALSGCVSDGPGYGSRPYAVVAAPVAVDVYRTRPRYNRPVYRAAPRRLTRAPRPYVRPATRAASRRFERPRVIRSAPVRRGPHRGPVRPPYRS